MTKILVYFKQKKVLKTLLLYFIFCIIVQTQGVYSHHFEVCSGEVNK